MFRQDFTSPALLESLFVVYQYGTITLFRRAVHLVLVSTSKALAWSDFARHYFRSLG